MISNVNEMFVLLPLRAPKIQKQVVVFLDPICGSHDALQRTLGLEKEGVANFKLIDFILGAVFSLEKN